MDLFTLKEKFQDYKPHIQGKYHTFSVLVPIVKVHDELELLFEVRSEKLKTQPGEICFPGGKIEKYESPIECAIRETSEELIISPDKIEIFTPLNYLITPFNLILYPFLGFIEENIKDINFNRDEVSHIFTVPLKYFIENDPLEYIIDIKAHIHHNFPFHMIQNGENYQWREGKYPILFYTYENYIIWGMTARIIENFINILKK